VMFIDGLRRPLQTKKDATVHTGPSTVATDVMTVSGRVTFDQVGRIVETFHPTTEALGTPGTFNATPDTVQPTRTAYDILDRFTSVTLPDNTVTTRSYGFGTDRSGATQFQQAVTDANGITKRSYRNVRELITSLQEFHTPAGGSQQTIWTSYSYDALNQFVGIRDDHNNVSGAGYDNLGRRTSVDTPDSGRTEMVFDLAGNQTAEITANLRATSQQVSYVYDVNRLTSIRYPNFPGNNVTYTYGAPGAADNRAGRITRVTDESGVEDRFYGKLGETVKEIWTVDTDTGQDDTYTTQYTFDTFGRMQSMVYPDGEILTYRYDSGGMLRQVSGVKEGRTYPYVNRLEYDKFSQRAFLAAGNGTQTSYTFDPLDRRLTNLRAGPAGGTPFQNLLYDYDNVGNVQTLRNDVPVPPPSQDGGPTTQTFGYDDLYRLTNASGTYEFSPGKLNRYTFSQSYDSIHNLLSKQQNNDVVQPPGNPVTQMKTTFSQNYQYALPKPHAATHVGTQAFTYDPNGNQTSWAEDGSGQQRTVIWDEENRIQSVSDNGHEMTYKYDDSGERVIKRGPQGETAYVNQFFSIRNRQIGTKHILAGTTRVASKLVKRNAEEKDQYYFHPDHLGSNSYITDASGQIFRHTEFFPSGEAWIDEASNKQRTPYLFAGKELDEDTGLYYFGARYYDPRTGVWESADPAANSYLDSSAKGAAYDSGNLAAYNYARQNPLNNVDPDGKAAVADDLLVVGAIVCWECAAVAAVVGLVTFGVVYMVSNSSPPAARPEREVFTDSHQFVTADTMEYGRPGTSERVASPGDMTKAWQIWTARTAAAATATTNDQGLPTYVVDAARFPNVARNIQSALDRNDPRIPGTLTYHGNPLYTWANRTLACGMVGAKMPNSCDEYPFASTLEGGPYSQTRIVPWLENSLQGLDYWAFLRRNRILPGGRFNVETTLGPGGGGAPLPPAQ